MTEIKDHTAYELLNTEYERVCLDYVILSVEEKYEGLKTHKKAVIEAFQILNKRFESYDYSVNICSDKMTAAEISVDVFLELPPDDFEKARSYTVTPQIPYWYAFLSPPQRTPYKASDFIEFNKTLFSDTSDIEVYRWNDDFSDYFDAGKEWWGTGLWTVFDKTSDTMVVIGASLTD